MSHNNDILDDQTQRTKGVDAQSSNIEAAKAVSELIKTTLGPMGMDKMLIDSAGDTIITNDGVKILQEMDIEHPGAKLLVDVAKTQESEVGDGTTTAVILSGELLGKAQELLKQKIHATTIVRGYKKASQKSLEILDTHAKTIESSDEKQLKEVCETAMTGKVAEFSREHLTSLIYEAAMAVKTEAGLPKDRIKIQKAAGGNTEDSFTVNGIVLDKQMANINMPETIKDASVLLVDFPLEVRELDNETKVNISSLEAYEEFIKGEQEYLKSLVRTIQEIGANVVICQKGIDDSVAYYLAKQGILAIRRTRKSDLEKLSFALNVPVVSNFEDLNPEQLGKAENVAQKTILGESYIFVEGCKNPKSMTIFLKGSTRQVLDEIERAVEDALGDLNSLLGSMKIVPGGGAIEMELHRQLIDYAKQFNGKEQLIISSFAESFLSVPKTLCQNSGFDEIETIAKLIAMHEQQQAKAGIDGLKGVLEDTLSEGIVEPINVKAQAIKSATEISSMILRIDDIIAARTLKNSSQEQEE